MPRFLPVTAGSWLAIGPSIDRQTTLGEFRDQAAQGEMPPNTSLDQPIPVRAG
jgi:hypothetical protein